MDKYRVLLILVVYYIVLTVTTFVFTAAPIDMYAPSMTGGGGMLEASSGWSLLSTFLLSVFLPIPYMSEAVRAILTFPFWALLIYFLYLNIPTIAGSGSPNP